MDRLALSGTFGGNDAIAAFCEIHDVEVVVHRPNHPSLVLYPASGRSGDRRVLHISYHNGNHYNSMRPIERQPAEETDSSGMDNSEELDTSQAMENSEEMDTSEAMANSEKIPSDTQQSSAKNSQSQTISISSQYSVITCLDKIKGKF